MKLNFDRAFFDKRIFETEHGVVKFSNHCIGNIIISSGSVIACDPFLLADITPFTRKIPVGIYPVILSVGDFENDNDQRVAYAKIQINDNNSTHWELALLPDQDLSTFENEDDFFGYPVDSGTGCFMDAETAKILLKKFDEDESFSDFMISEMEKNYVHTWDWADIRFNASDGNLIAFKSGLGDGSYPTFFGFDTEGNITNVVTDFFILDDKEVYSYGEK